MHYKHVRAFFLTDAGISGAQADDSSWAVASFGKDFEYNVRVMKFNMGPVTGQQLAVHVVCTP
jgi:hypothetical protein